LFNFTLVFLIHYYFVSSFYFYLFSFLIIFIASYNILPLFNFTLVFLIHYYFVSSFYSYVCMYGKGTNGCK